MKYADKCEHIDRRHFAKGLCASCYQKEVYRSMSPEQKTKHHQYSKNWDERNPETSRLMRLRSKLKQLYSISLEEYNALMLVQCGSCAICSEIPQPPERLHVDHNHKNGVIRGLLCSKCNRGIGQLNDDSGLLRLAADYIDEI